MGITIGSGVTITGGLTFTEGATTPSVTSYTLYSWGSNSYFYPLLGLGDTVYRSSPTQVGASNAWISNSGTLGIKSNGTLWAWGNDSDGQLGLNTTQPGGEAPGISSPTQVGSATDWQTVFTSANQGDQPRSAAIKTNGTLWVWGAGYIGGSLGLNSLDSKSSPTQVGAATNWSSISFGKYHALALKTDGTLWTWGNNNFGELGSTTVTPRSSPVQVGTDTNWSLVSGGAYSSFAVKTNGTIWAWGRNNNSQLGINDTVSRSSPVQIGSATDWATVSTNDYINTTLAVKTNGTLYAWGPNANGELGLNDRVARSSPTQVGTDTNWSKVRSGSQNVLAIKTTGTLWAWGQNSSGQLGLNDLVTRSSPTQVGSGTTWISNSGSDDNYNALYSSFGFRS